MALHAGQNGVNPRPKVAATPTEGDFLQNALGMLHNTFSSGKHRGRRLLGVGIGPYTCVYSVASASRVFPHITISCQASHKLHELQQWVDRQVDVASWGSIFQYIAGLEAEDDNGKGLEDRLRDAIKTILPCDIMRENPFGSNEQDPFDCVISALCLETVSRDIGSYEKAVKNVLQILSPGGTIVILGILNRKYFEVGRDRLYPQRLSIEDVFAIFGRAGFVEKETITQSFPAERLDYVPVPEWNGYFLMTARRPYTCNSEICTVEHG